MRLVQDDYHRDVSAYVGLLRIGPGGKRLEREDYMAMKADAEQTRTMLHDIEARSEKIEETLTAAQGVGLQAQQMGVVMLQKAKQRAETIEANARAHAQIVKDEARRVHEEKIRLTEWADTLKNSAKKIAANTAHMVEIVVPSEPQPARIQVAPQANERPKDATPWTGGTPGPGSW